MNPEERIVGDRKYIMFYMDENDNAIDKEHATKFIARTEDLNGNILEETFGIIAPRRQKERDNEDDEVAYFSQDEYDRLKQINEEKGWGMDFSRIRVRQTTPPANRCLSCEKEIIHYPCPHCGFDLARYQQPKYALPLRTVLRQQYSIGKLLGQNGYCITYVGWDLKRGQKVIIKEYYPMSQVFRDATSTKLIWHSRLENARSKQEGIKKFLKEYENNIKLEKIPEVVHILASFLLNETAYIVMDYIEGQSLKNYLFKKGILNWESAQKIFFPLITAMDEVHKTGVVHGGLIPDNLIIGDDGIIKILGFDAAKDMSEDIDCLYRPGLPTAYFSPIEQYIREGVVGPWTDVYAVAAMIYYAITGKLPTSSINRRSETIDGEEDSLQWDLPQLRVLPSNVITALKNAMAIRGNERTQSMHEFLSQLTQFYASKEKLERIWDFHDQIKGCLFGGAIGDALGYPIENLRDQEIFRRYGVEGIRDYTLLRDNKVALVSDDTQMTLFTLNALLVSDTRACLYGNTQKPREVVAEAYQDWLKTQEKQTFFSARKPKRTLVSWILDIPEVHHRRGPGKTCLTALHKERKKPRHGDFMHPPINKSCGCGGIMRVAPVALNYPDRSLQEVTMEAAQIAAITHGHPLGYLPAAVLVYILHRIVYPSECRKTLKEIVIAARDKISEWFSREKYIAELNNAINLALKLAENNHDDAHNINLLGEGWTAHETLAIAIYCSLRHQDDFSKGIIAAVSHKGDSDSTGAVTGNILGAWIGFDKIEDKWKWDLDLYDVIKELTDDMLRSLSKDKRVYQRWDWQDKYVKMKQSSMYKNIYEYCQCENGWYCRIGMNIDTYEVLNSNNEWEDYPALEDMYFHGKYGRYDFNKVQNPKLIRKLESYKRHEGVASGTIFIEDSNKIIAKAKPLEAKEEECPVDHLEANYESLKVKTEETKKAFKIYDDYYWNRPDEVFHQIAYHPLELANKMKDEYAVAVALLNDMVKTGHLSIGSLRQYGFSQQATDALSLLNNGKSILDKDYILALRNNPAARAVMAVDMEMHEPDQWTKFPTKEEGREDLKRRFVRVILDDDKFDYTGKRIKKRFQLDHERLFFLTVVYTDDGVHHYTIDVEKASDSHYELSAEAGRQLQQALNPKLSLWEGLMLYLEDHGEGSLLSLMDRENIKYSQMHFTFWGNWDE